MPAAEILKATIGRFFDPGKTEKVCALVVTLALILVVARTGADLTWQLAVPLLSQGSSSGANKVVDQLSPNQPQPAPKHAAPAEEIALFGQATATPPPPGSSLSETAPATNLNLVLKGIVAVRPMRRALAIIGDRGGAGEKLYGQGEELPGNAVIREIHVDKIIISRNGVLETLFLEGSQNPASNTASAPPQTTRTSSAGNNIRPGGDGTNWQINQEYWQERLADVPGLAREVGVEVYKENDQQKGYRLVSVQNSKLLNDLGLQPGDILLSVNGRTMNSVQEGLTAYQQIKNGGQITIEINRGGRRETRTYNVGG